MCRFFFSCSSNCKCLVLGLWAALAEQMEEKWLFLEAKTLLIPFQHRDFPSWCGESNRYKLTVASLVKTYFTHPKNTLKFLINEVNKTRPLLFSFVGSSLVPSPNSMLLFSPADSMLSNLFLNSIITYPPCQKNSLLFSDKRVTVPNHFLVSHVSTLRGWNNSFFHYDETWDAR